MQRKDFNVGHVRLSIAQSGQGHPFIFQHGLCGSADQTLAVFPKDTNWQLLTMECRGHGDSDFGESASLSIAQFTQDLAAFITDLDIGPVLVGGISMGAAMALRLAVKHPKLVRGLVLARPAWICEAAPENLAPNREVAALLAEYEPSMAKSKFENSRTAVRLKHESPDNLASLIGFFDRAPHSETQALLAAIASDGPGISRSEIANLDVRTLIIATAHDAIHPLSMARELAGLIADVRLVEITSKTSNPVQYQAEFQSALRRFLQEFE